MAREKEPVEQRVVGKLLEDTDLERGMTTAEHEPARQSHAIASGAWSGELRLLNAEDQDRDVVVVVSPQTRPAHPDARSAHLVIERAVHDDAGESGARGRRPA